MSSSALLCASRSAATLCSGASGAEGRAGADGDFEGGRRAHSAKRVAERNKPLHPLPLTEINNTHRYDITGVLLSLPLFPLTSPCILDSLQFGLQEIRLMREILPR